jgi:hypothetical protein
MSPHLLVYLQAEREASGDGEQEQKKSGWANSRQKISKMA